jgi:hypothetical protein
MRLPGLLVSVSPIPGLPPLRDFSAFMPSQTSFQSSDSANLPQDNSGGQWGIFDTSGNQVVTADTVLGFEFRQDYHISEYPQQRGGFASYNKVTIPYDARVHFAQAGKEADRGQFLTTLNAVAGSLNLFDVVTPEYIWHNANVVHVDFRRESTNGAGMIKADVWLKEVRQATAELTSTAPALPAAKVANPASADAQSQGQIQPATMTTQQGDGVSQVISKYTNPILGAAKSGGGVGGGW